MLALSNLTFHNQGRAVLRDLSLTISPGEAVLVTGANGSGKSALGAAAAGILPVRGTVTCGGKRLGARTRRSIGYLPQSGGLYEYLSAAEFLEFYASLAAVPRRERAKLVNDLLELVGLSGVAASETARLTEGQRRRLLLARALVGDPAWLVLDEPLQGLDGSGRQEAVQLLADLKKMGKGLLILSGDVSNLPYDRLFTMSDGALVPAGSLEEESV